MRDWRKDDIARLIAVETAADGLFAQHGYPHIAEAPPREPSQLHKLLIVKDVVVAADENDGACGFALAGDIGDCCWLYQIAVHPAHGRKGLGTALLHAVLRRGLTRGKRYAALSTFRRVPYNAPFYEKHGFHELPLDQAPADLAGQFEMEVPPDVDRLDRVLMRRRLTVEWTDAG